MVDRMLDFSLSVLILEMEVWQDFQSQLMGPDDLLTNGIRD